MSKNVFLSYASEDKQFAELAKKSLTDLGHLPADTVFFDVQDMSAGENIRQRLKSEMKASDTVVLVVTENSALSQWINYEAGMADALGKNILVVCKKGTGKSSLVSALSTYKLITLN